jgi:tripartite-type tricarboxylate transporter receptor subunit TctC
MPTWRYALVVLSCLAAAPAQGQSYPTRPITLVVTAAAGGVSDLIARAVGQRLTQAWGQQVVIENRGGAAHVLGAQTVARAAPDGHTLLVAEAGTFVINPTLYPAGKLPYDTVNDFAPITGLIRINQALIARNSLPAADVSGLIKLAKQRPGELTYGTAGVGSAPQMNLVKFENMAGVSLRPIHYRGAAPALNDIMAAHIDVMSVSVSLVVQPYQEGKLKILAVGARQRVSQLPDRPTVSESGLRNYEAATWFGLVGPKALPTEIVMKINAEVRKILSDRAFQERFLDVQMFESMASSPEQFSIQIKSEAAEWGQIIREQQLVIQ